MNNRKLTTTGMIVLSCLVLIASVLDISTCYIKNGRIVFLQNADILVAIEFVSTKMTVSFSKESLRSFFSSLLALIHDSALWRGNTHNATTIRYGAGAVSDTHNAY